MVGNLGGQLTTTYKPAQGQVMVWVMGWESSETTTTTYVTKQLNLIGDGVDPLGWLTNKNTTKKGPYVTYAQSRPVLVSTVVAYTSESSVPGVLRDQLAASGKLKDVVLPNYVEGSGKQELRADPNGPIYIPGLGRFSVVTVGGQQLESSDFVVTYRKYNTSVIVRNDGPHSSGGGWLRTKTTTLTQVVEKKQQELYTFYVPASQDINLTFLGSSSQPNAVYIRSNGDVTLGGNVIVGNGKTVRIEAVSSSKSTSITTRGEVGILARDPNGQIQPGTASVNVEAYALGGSIQLNVMGSAGYTRAEARNDIRLTYFSEGGTSSRAMLQKVASSAGTVYIEALNGIYAHASAGNDTVVLGNRVELNAGYGAIGSAAKVLSIHARQGFAAQAGLAGGVAGADKSIYIAQNVANADLVLVKPVNWVNPQASVYSQLGSVSITLNGGSLLDGEKADTRTATEKAYPTVTARILADLNAQIARYEGYWSGVRALQVASITLGGAGTFLSTQLEGDGRYLAVAFERAGDYEALLKAAVDGGRLVRLAYNNSLNGNARQEILGKLIAVSNDGLNYRFQFSVYDSATGLFAAPVSMASLGYTAGSQGVVRPGLWPGRRHRHVRRQPADPLHPAGDVARVDPGVRRPADDVHAGAAEPAGRQRQWRRRAGRAAQVHLCRDRRPEAADRPDPAGHEEWRVLGIAGLRHGADHAEDALCGHLRVDQRPRVAQCGAGRRQRRVWRRELRRQGPGRAARGAGQRNAGQEPAGWRQRHHECGHRGDQRLQHRPSLGQDPDRPGFAVRPADQHRAGQGRLGDPAQRHQQYHRAGRCRPGLADSGHRLVGAGIRRLAQRPGQWPGGQRDQADHRRRRGHAPDPVLRPEARGRFGVHGHLPPGQLSVAGAGRYRHAEALLRARRQRHRRRPAAAVRTDLRPDGPGQGDNKGEIAYAIRRGLGATALMQGSLAVDSRSAWGWWGNQNLTFYQYTETTTGGAARYGNYVSLGNGFSWDLSASNLSDAARIQMLNAIKSLLASGQNISLTGLDLFMTNDGTTRTGHQLGVYDNGKLKIVSVVDEFGNPLTAQSPDSAWLKGRIVFAGDVYAEESQLKALYAYRNLDTNDPNWSQKPIDLGGMVVNAGIRLVDSGFAQQSLAARARPR